MPFTLFTAALVTWQSAKEMCAARNLALATLSTSALADALLAAVRPFNNSIWPSGAPFWIGGSDAAVEGTWTWVDETPWLYTRWITGTVSPWQWPRNYAGHNCLQQTTTMDLQGGWADNDCSDRLPVLCSPPGGRDPLLQRLASVLRLPGATLMHPVYACTLAYSCGWQSMSWRSLHLRFAGSSVPEITLQGATYRVYQFQKSWLDAQEYCQKYGLTLPTLYNAAHFAAVNAEVRKLLPLGRYWTGYNDIQTEGAFKWADNSTGSLQLTAGTWNPFCNGEPNNHNGVQDTVAVGSSGCWDDTEAEGAFVCTTPGDSLHTSYQRDSNNHYCHHSACCTGPPSSPPLANHYLWQLSGVVKAWLPAALSEP